MILPEVMFPELDRKNYDFFYSPHENIHAGTGFGWMHEGDGSGQWGNAHGGGRFYGYDGVGSGHQWIGP